VRAGLQRCGKSCRLRWINYLRPDLKRGSFSQQEEDLIVALHEILGNRSVAASRRNAFIHSSLSRVSAMWRREIASIIKLATMFMVMARLMD